MPYLTYNGTYLTILNSSIKTSDEFNPILCQRDIIEYREQPDNPDAGQDGCAMIFSLSKDITFSKITQFSKDKLIRQSQPDGKTCLFGRLYRELDHDKDLKDRKRVETIVENFSFTAPSYEVTFDITSFIDRNLNESTYNPPRQETYYAYETVLPNPVTLKAETNGQKNYYIIGLACTTDNNAVETSHLDTTCLAIKNAIATENCQIFTCRTMTLGFSEDGYVKLKEPISKPCDMYPYVLFDDKIVFAI